MPRKAAKPAEAKRARLPRRSDYAKDFLKDWTRLSRSGRYDMRRLREAMLLIIAAEGPLPPEWQDHELKGKWSEFRELHVGGDFLLIYRLEGESVIFPRCGTHSELFE